MKILVYGAGVIGTLYAAWLRESGHDVTLLARGERLADIRRHGLVLEDLMSGGRTITQVETTERIDPDDRYDLALIMVRRDQLADVLPVLTSNRSISTLLFMLNNPVGSSDLVEALGPERVLLGFPGAGGTRDGYVVRYALIAQQPTTLGELDGRRTPRVAAIAEAFRGAGFKTAVSSDMDAWLKAHAFFVTAVSGAIYLAGGDCRRLSADKAVLALMSDGVREGFAAVRSLGLPVAPFPLKVLFLWLPRAFPIYYWGRFLATQTADYIFGSHARAACEEMRVVAEDCKTLVKKAGVKDASLRRLYDAIDSYAAGRPVRGTH